MVPKISRSHSFERSDWKRIFATGFFDICKIFLQGVSKRLEPNRVFLAEHLSSEFENVKIMEIIFFWETRIFCIVLLLLYYSWQLSKGGGCGREHLSGLSRCIHQVVFGSIQ